MTVTICYLNNNARTMIYVDTRVTNICLMFSKITVITRITLKKAAIIWKMSSKMADIMVWCIWQYFFWNLLHTKPIHIVNIGGSAPLMFWDRRITLEMAAVCKMGFTMSDRMVWYIWQYFFWNLRPTKPIHRVNIGGSAPLSFWDRRNTLEMAAIL